MIDGPCATPPRDLLERGVGSTEVFADADGNLNGFALHGIRETVGGWGQLMSASGSGSVSCSADIPGQMVGDVSGEIAYDAAGSAEQYPSASGLPGRGRSTWFPHRQAPPAAVNAVNGAGHSALGVARGRSQG